MSRLTRDPLFHTPMGRPVTGRTWAAPLVAAIVVGSTSGPLHLIGGHWWLRLAIVLVGVAGFGSLIALVGGERFSNALQLTLIAAVVVGVGWLLWASFPVAWRPGAPRTATLLVLTVAGFIGVPLWGVVRYRQVEYEDARWRRLGQPALPPAPAPPPLPPAPPPRNEWEVLHEECGRQPGDVRFISRTMDRSGNIRIRMRIMNPKVTFDAVRAMAPNLEIALAHRRTKPLPVGACTYERYEENGVTSPTDFVLHVNTVNILSQTLWMPEDNEPRSILDLFTMGHFQDDIPFEMTIDEIHWFIVAPPGQGKSSFYDALIYKVTQCYDCATIVIDFKHGKLAKKWCRAWADRAIHPDTNQPVSRPPLLFVAIDRHETERIYRALIEEANDRAARSDNNRWMPTRDEPLILLIVDEQSRITGQHVGPSYSTDAEGLSSNAFGNLETDLTSISRSSGILVMKASQRATVTTAGKGDANANYLGRIALGSTDVQDARMVFPKSAHLAQLTAALTTRGTYLVSSPRHHREMPVKGFFLGDGDQLNKFVYKASIYRGEIVPYLRPGTRSYEVFARWGLDESAWTDPERIGWLLGTHVGPWRGKPINPPTPTTPVGSAAAGAGGGVATQLLTKMQTVQTAAAPAGPPKQQSFAVWDDEPATDGDDTVDVAGNRLAQAVRHITSLVEGYGTTGCTWSQLSAAMIGDGWLTQKNISHLSRWIAAAKRQGLIVQRPEPRGAYYVPTAAPPPQR